jgi:hypothetical protein
MDWQERPAASGKVYVYACKVRESICVESWKVVKNPGYGGMNFGFSSVTDMFDASRVRPEYNQVLRVYSLGKGLNRSD